MLNPKDRYVMKVVEQLEKENLFSAEELSLIEDYLCGDVGGEVLEKFDYRDLSNMSGSMAIHNLYVNMLDQGRHEEAKRLENLLFAIGEASGYKMFSLLAYCYRKNDVMLEPAKKAAIHACLIGESAIRMKKFDFTSLIANAENNPKNLEKAMKYRTGVWSKGTIILLTAYFYLKYPARFYLKYSNANDESMAVAGEDVPLMKQYEALAVGYLYNMYPGQNGISGQDVDEITAAIMEHRVDERILKLAGRSPSIVPFYQNLLTGVCFVNYILSPILKDIVSICLAANGEAALNNIAELDLREIMDKQVDRFDTIFGMDSKTVILWAAKHNKLSFLTDQFTRNQKVFMECLDSADYATYNLLVNVVKEMDPKLFQERAEGELIKQQSKLIDEFAHASQKSQSVMNDITQYLSGKGGINHVYACKDTLKEDYHWSMKSRQALQAYRNVYGCDALHNRCDTLLFAANGYSLYHDFVNSDRNVNRNEVKRVFAAINSEGLDLATQLSGYAYIADYGYAQTWVRDFEDESRKIFSAYLAEKREEMLAAFQEAGSLGRSFGLSVLAQQPKENKENILGYAQDSAKSVKEVLLDILYVQKDWKEEIVGLLSSKKAAERDVAIRVLARWRDEAEGTAQSEATVWAEGAMSAKECTQVLTQALEVEKNAKVKALLETVLHISVETAQDSQGGQGGQGGSLEDMVKELHKGNKKRSLAWAYGTPFSKVHKKDGTEATEEYLQAIFLCYYAMSPCGVNKSAASLAQELNEREFAVYVNELFDKWLEAGAESKKRWVLYAAAIHGGSDIVKKLQHQIQEWPQASRGAIASEAVQALALSPEPQGLLIVDGISRKFKFKQVKAAATAALEFAASQLGITTEELADRIVPNLGFDENMQRIFDYGERKFTVSITPALEIEIFDESGKKLKNLPAPGKKDDEAKATAAYDEFKQMKKQMKTTVSSQKMRLEMALSTERQWSVQAWKDLFVKNPIMHQFAIGLIWGVYQDRKLVSSFRYMEDGSFNTEDEEEFFLPEEQLSNETQSPDQDADQTNAIDQAYAIGLIHPIELSKESLETWKGQLEDYEIVQPIEQLDRQIYYRTEEEGDQITLERFGGVIVNDLSLGGKLTAQGWYRGSVEDGGGFYTYYREDKELGLGAVLYFSGSYVGGANEDVTVYEIRFFNAGRLSTWSYDNDVDNKSCMLSKVPERYFSEIVLQVAKATATSTEKNANWKK